MKYIDEYRDGEQARHIAANIAAEVRPGHSYRFMEFCGGHTHAIARYGIAGLLPDSVRMIHGPGCPVCVLPIGRIDLAIRLALERGVMLCTYGDTMRVPASEGLSLIQAKARGADVRMVYSAADALALADKHPEREVVFLAIGFETTTPPTALVLREARLRAVPNFSVLCCHVLTPAAITHILESAEVRQLGTVPIDGFIGPAHVSIVIGSQPYEHFAEEYRKPVVISGFEPLDVMQGILMLVRQVNAGRAVVENEFSRAVTPEGNLAAQNLVDRRCSSCASASSGAAWARCPTARSRSARPMPRGTPSASSTCITPACPTTGSASAAPSCVASSAPPTASCSAPCARPRAPWVRAWCPTKGACAAHYAYGRFKDIPVVSA
jgi:hydrogenase expression/formation protein HypD